MLTPSSGCATEVLTPLAMNLRVSSGLRAFVAKMLFYTETLSKPGAVPQTRPLRQSLQTAGRLLRSRLAAGQAVPPRNDGWCS